LKDWSENGASLTAYILVRVHGLAEREGREEGEREEKGRKGFIEGQKGRSEKDFF